MGLMTFTPSMRAFRYYEDGTESGSTAIDAQDTNITRSVNSNSNLLFRARIQETSGGTNIITPTTWQLQYSKNSGTWTNITTSTSNVKAFDSTNLTDGGATTNRLGAGTGSFVAGLVEESGLIDDFAGLSASNYTELLYTLTLVSADLANNDTLDFRITYNGTTMTDTVSPRITASKGGTSYNETGAGGGTVNSTVAYYMMSTFWHHYTVPSAFTAAIAGASSAPTLKNLSSGSNKLGNAIDLTSTKELFSNWELKVKFQSSPVANNSVDLYFIKSVDGTNYETGDDSTAPTSASYVGSFLVQSNTNSQIIVLKNIKLPNCIFKPLVINNAGQSFTNVDNDNVLSYTVFKI